MEQESTKAFADVDEGGKISITCIAKGAKPQAHIYWNSDPPLNFDDIHEENPEDHLRGEIPHEHHCRGKLCQCQNSEGILERGC